MFTGLITEVGTIKSISNLQNDSKISINSKLLSAELKIGDSVAVNGACLTVVAKGNDCFTADVMPETMKLTNLCLLKPGSKVNLERTLRLSDGLDGHLVSGHVEGTGTISATRKEGIAQVITIRANKALLKYIIVKGSIAIDGISLTVIAVTPDSFSVSLIPHTLQETTLKTKTIEDVVNLETDLIAKYVEQFLINRTANTSSLTKAILVQNGFI